MIAHFPTSPTISPSLSTHTKVSPPSIWQSVTPPPAADGPAVGSPLILLRERTAHTLLHNQPPSLTYTRV